MKTFLSGEALVAAYWRKLARSIDNPRIGKRAKLSPSARRPENGKTLPLRNVFNRPNS